jgi:hypothetical protein
MIIFIRIWHFVTLRFFKPISIQQIASHIQHPAVVSLIGNTVLALALILLGPSPFLPLKPSRSLIGGSLALVGFCSALLMVASFLRANRTAINEGFQDDINTYIFVSGYSTFY